MKADHDGQAVERPILFSGPLVRAILEGRKTQTRRVCKPSWLRYLDPSEPEDHAAALAQCPYGQPGDRLWVRETFAQMWNDEPCGCGVTFCPGHEHVEYRADTGNPLPGEWPAELRGEPGSPRWRPSVHMPRWASRINLLVTHVRLERLQEIGEADILAEGVDVTGHATPHEVWVDLWDSINGKRDGGAYVWARNPWVWVVEFRRLEVGEALRECEQQLTESEAKR